MYDLKQNYNEERIKKTKKIRERSLKKKSKNKTNSTENTQGHRGEVAKEVDRVGRFPSTYTQGTGILRRVGGALSSSRGGCVTFPPRFLFPRLFFLSLYSLPPTRHEFTRTTLVRLPFSVHFKKSCINISSTTSFIFLLTLRPPSR